MRLIDADRLLSDRMKGMYYHLPNGDTAIPIIDIEHAPTIEERKKGKWIVDDEFIDCSVCRKEKWSRIPYGDLVRRFRYCPNCGARMEGIDETY